MKPKIGVLYYSMTRNTFIMAQAVLRGIEEEGSQAILRTVPELLPTKQGFRMAVTDKAVPIV